MSKNPNDGIAMKTAHRDAMAVAIRFSMAMQLIKNSNGSAVLRKSDRDEVSTCAALLFRALAATNGDSAIVRAGQCPMMITPIGRVLLAREPLTNSAVASLISQLLPESLRDRLDREGFATCERPADLDLAGERFIIKAAKRGDGRSLEIGRTPKVLSLPSRVQPRANDDDLLLPSEEELWPSAFETKAFPPQARWA